MNKEEIDTITDLLFGNGYDMLKTINDLSNKLKIKDKEIEQLKEEIKTLYRYTPEKGFELVGDDND